MAGAMPSTNKKTLNKSAPFLSLRDVSIRLDGKILFPGTNWEIRSDQHWAVIGANGSGKSTLVKALCGDLPIVHGQLVYHFAGAPPEEAAKKTWLPNDFVELVSIDACQTIRRREGGFYQARWNSLAEEGATPVSEYLSMKSVYRINPFEIRQRHPDPLLFSRERDETTVLVGIRELLNKRVIELSNGEMRKLLIARALLRKPRLLILDNPFTGLDADYRIRLKGILGRLMKGSMRIIVVTTSLEDIPPGITHALVIQDLRVLSQGPLEEIVEGDSARAISGEEPFDPALHLARHPRGPDSCEKGFPLVSMRDVHVRYYHQEILTGIHWSVRKGEHWVIMGPNGSGKSTLLSLILGDNPQAYANDIRLFGRCMGSGESIWEIKQRIGYVSPELHQQYRRETSCFDVVCSGFFDSIGLYRSCAPEQTRTVSEWMEKMNIERHQGKSFKDLSEGQQRMVLLARALVKRPVILVLDEPCQGLDPSNSKRFLRILEEVVTALDLTLIYVTHVSREVPRIITHRLVLDHGRIKEEAQAEFPNCSIFPACPGQD